MLRASALTNQTEIDLHSIRGNHSSANKGIEFGPSLLAFAESIALRDTPEITKARNALLQVAGPHVVVDAAAVAANFQRMVRIADAIGIPVDNMNTELGQQVRAELNLEEFPSAQNTLHRLST